MTRTIDSSQIYLDSQLVPVDLIRLTTYTNRDSKTVDRRFYFARQAIRFDWNNEGTNREFWPVIQRIGPLTTEINHLGSPQDSGLMRKPLTIELSNEPIPSESSQKLIVVLRNYMLENATIEWTQLLLANRPTNGRLDLSALTGNEHTFWYRGRVRRIGPIDEQAITLDCETDMPKMAWTRELDQTKNDPKDFGKRIPAPFGEDPLVRLTGTVVGWVTTLADTIQPGDTGVKQTTDGTGFPPSGSFTVKVGVEEMTVTKSGSNGINISARGINNTRDQAHAGGEIVIEMIAKTSFTFSGWDDWGIGCGGPFWQGAYFMNPNSGELVGGVGGSPQIMDTSIVPGENRDVLNFSTSTLRTALEELFGQVFGASDGTKTEISFATRDVEVGSSMAYGDSMLNPQQIPSSPKLWGDPSDSGSNYYTVRGWFGNDTIPGEDRIVTRWRGKIVFSAKNTHVVSNQYVYARCQLHNFEGSPLNGTANEVFYNQAPYNQETYGLAAVGAWHVPDDGTTLADFESAGPTGDMYARLYGDINGIDPALLFNADEWIEWTFFGIEVELQAPPGDAAGAFVGFNLDVWAKTYSRYSPTTDPDYKCGDMSRMLHPVDIIRFWVEEVGGATLDYDSYDDAYGYLGSGAKWAVDARTLGDTWEEILARMAYEARAVMVPEETSSGTVWKILVAPSNYGWLGVTARAITEWESFTEADQDVGSYAAHATRFTFPYAPNWSKADTEDAFTQVVVINKDNNDVADPSTAELTAIEAKIGALEAEPWAFRCIQDQATAEDVAGWYAHERIRVPARLFAIRGVPWWQAYDTEVGDRLYVIPPWETEQVKCRVLAYTKDPETERIDVRLMQIADSPIQSTSIHVDADASYMRTNYSVYFFVESGIWTMHFRHKETIAVGSRPNDNWYAECVMWDDSDQWKITVLYDCTSTPSELRIVVWGSGSQRKDWMWYATEARGYIWDTIDQWYSTFITWDGTDIKIYTGTTGNEADLGAPNVKTQDYPDVDQSGQHMRDIQIGRLTQFKIHNFVMWSKVLSSVERAWLSAHKTHDLRENKDDYQSVDALDLYFRYGDGDETTGGQNKADNDIDLDMWWGDINCDWDQVISEVP